MAEELINALTQIPALRVVSRTSSFQFKGKTDDVAHDRPAAGVRTLLEGSVRTAGERMRIGARLRTRPTATSSGPRSTTAR